jgi:hypothetical protein
MVAVLSESMPARAWSPAALLLPFGPGGLLVRFPVEGWLRSGKCCWWPVATWRAGSLPARGPAKMSARRPCKDGRILR